MAALGTLVTIVTADTTGFKAGMESAAESAKRFEQRVNESTGGIRSKMLDLKSSLGSFKDISTLMFGANVGGQVFKELHEAAEKFGAGFGEALKHGQDFGSALADGLKSMLGMETSVAKIARHMKENAEAAQLLGKQQDIRADLRGDDEGKPAYEVEADAKVKQLEELAREANAKARDGRDQLSALKINRAEVQAARDRGGILAPLNDLTLSSFDDKIAAAQKEHGGKIQAAEEAEENLRRGREEAELFKERKRAAELDKEAREMELEETREDEAARQEFIEERMRQQKELFEQEGEAMKEAYELAQERHRELEKLEKEKLEELERQQKEAAAANKIDFASGAGIHDMLQRAVVTDKILEQEKKQTDLLEDIEKNTRDDGKKFETGGLV